jgi:hypothetical protein
MAAALSAKRAAWLRKLAGEANFSSNAAFIAERSAAVTVPCTFLM